MAERKNRFASLRSEPRAEYPEPEASVGQTAPAVPPAIAPVLVNASPAAAYQPSPEPVVPRSRVLSDRVSFSTRVSPRLLEQLSELVRDTGKTQTRLVEEALLDLMVKYRRIE